MELQKLNLSDNDKNAISRTARLNKFSPADTKIIYESDPKKYLKLFLECIRFLSNLKNSEYEESIIFNQKSDEDNSGDKDDSKIQLKLRIFLKNLFPIINEGLDLHRKICGGRTYGNRKFMKKVIQFNYKNKDQIDYVIDIVYQMGKKNQTYDPSETQGYY